MESRDLQNSRSPARVSVSEASQNRHSRPWSFPRGCGAPIGDGRQTSGGAEACPAGLRGINQGNTTPIREPGPYITRFTMTGSHSLSLEPGGSAFSASRRRFAQTPASFAPTAKRSVPASATNTENTQ